MSSTIHHNLFSGARDKEKKHILRKMSFKHFLEQFKIKKLSHRYTGTPFWSNIIINDITILVYTGKINMKPNTSFPCELR